MSNENQRKHFGSNLNFSTSQKEYQIIKNDLWKVFLLNIIYFAAIITLYFFDKRNNILNILFDKVFKL